MHGSNDASYLTLYCILLKIYISYLTYVCIVLLVMIKARFLSVTYKTFECIVNSMGHSLSLYTCTVYTHIWLILLAFLVIEQVKSSIMTGTWWHVEWSTAGFLRCAFQTGGIDCLCLSTVQCSKNTAVLICNDTVLRAVWWLRLCWARSEREARLSWLFISLLGLHAWIMVLALVEYFFLLNPPRSI